MRGLENEQLGRVGAGRLPSSKRAERARGLNLQEEGWGLCSPPGHGDRRLSTCARGGRVEAGPGWPCAP